MGKNQRFIARKRRNSRRNNQGQIICRSSTLPLPLLGFLGEICPFDLGIFGLYIQDTVDGVTNNASGLERVQLGKQTLIRQQLTMITNLHDASFGKNDNAGGLTNG